MPRRGGMRNAVPVHGQFCVSARVRVREPGPRYPLVWRSLRPWSASSAAQAHLVLLLGPAAFAVQHFPVLQTLRLTGLFGFPYLTVLILGATAMAPRPLRSTPSPPHTGSRTHCDPVA